MAGRRRVAPALTRTCLLLLAALLAATPGCGGCSQTQTAEEKQKEEEAKKEEAKKEKPKPKPDFERLLLTPEPSDRSAPVRAVKPGHWIAASTSAKANNFDFTGQLDTAPTDAQGNLLNLERTAFRLTTSRPAVLPKGQEKRLEMSLFVPAGGNRSWVTTHLRDRRTGREAMRETEVFNHMPSYQYFLLGLVSEPDRYRWLKVINSVRPPTDEINPDNVDDSYYRTQLPVIGQHVPLPADALCWTSLAYIVWDDIDPALLTPEQQQALLDWLHWGGQVIVSGPKTLDALRGSFLQPYLPAAAGAPLRLDSKALAALNEHWSIDGETSKPLVANRPWSAITLDKKPEAQFVVGTGELVAERLVGRGRIVVTAFRLLERDLMYWPSFDSFFNAALLARPRRTYWRPDEDRLDSNVPLLNWADYSKRRHDAELVSGLRYFSRDFRLPDRPRREGTQFSGDADEDPFAENSPAGNLYPYGSGYNNFAQNERERTQSLSDSGIGGWNDFGPIANDARDALKQAAGIRIPRRDFVLKVLLGYLAVLVPLNWALFRLLGRVEWAWAAAPLIALVCAGTVIWLAQLDIGFARSSTQIAVVELQAGYPRAHVTRYTALYTSLSTAYDVNLDQPTALALPFSTNPEFEMLPGQGRTTVDYRRDEQAHLEGYSVSSNSTGMIHTEHMAGLAGSLLLEEDGQEKLRLVNSTELALRGIGIIRRGNATTDESFEEEKPDGDNINDEAVAADDDDSEPQSEQPAKESKKRKRRLVSYEMAWVGDLDSGESASLRFLAGDERRFAREREQSVLTAAQHPADSLSLHALVELAEDPAALHPGDVRLVAWLEGEVPGMTIVPAAAQERHATLVVANLRFGPRPEPQHDTNLPIKAKPIEALEAEEDMGRPNP